MLISHPSLPRHKLVNEQGPIRIVVIEERIKPRRFVLKRLVFFVRFERAFAVMQGDKSKLELGYDGPRCIPSRVARPQAINLYLLEL